MDTASPPLLIEISPGELLDRIGILEIKLEHLADLSRRRNVQKELTQLLAVRAATVPDSVRLTVLAQDLKRVNAALWDVEDALRDCERRKDFGEGFIALARSVYLHNDERAAIKRRINELLDSELVEEKAYAAY